MGNGALQFYFRHTFCRENKSRSSPLSFFPRPRPRTHRAIQLLPGGGPAQRLSKLGRGSLGVGGVSRESYGASGEDGAKYIHCVEEPGQEQGGAGNGGSGTGGGVVVEWARRAAAAAGGVDVQEVLVKCRVGQFPSRKSFFLVVSGARAWV